MIGVAVLALAVLAAYQAAVSSPVEESNPPEVMESVAPVPLRAEVTPAPEETAKVEEQVNFQPIDPTAKFINMTGAKVYEDIKDTSIEFYEAIQNEVITVVEIGVPGTPGEGWSGVQLSESKNIYYIHSEYLSDTPIFFEEPLFTEVNETIYATTTANLRESYTTDSNKVGTLNTGDSLQRVGIGITGTEAEGWSKVLLNGIEVYVSTDLVSLNKPVVNTQATQKPQVQQPVQAEQPEVTTGDMQNIPSPRGDASKREGSEGAIMGAKMADGTATITTKESETEAAIKWASQ